MEVSEVVRWFSHDVEVSFAFGGICDEILESEFLEINGENLKIVNLTNMILIYLLKSTINFLSLDIFSK